MLKGVDGCTRKLPRLHSNEPGALRGSAFPWRRRPEQSVDQATMAVGDFARRLLGARQPQGEPGSLEPVSTGADHCEPVPTSEDNCTPLIFGSMRSAREHAQALAEMIREAGAYNRAIYQGEIEEWHIGLCEELGWIHRKWDAVGRELARLPGVRKGQVKLYGGRLTVYEVAPASEADAAVVELAAVER
jgi:hypothetical protein